jgi:hypothetical protein
MEPHNRDGPIIFSPPPRPVILPGGRSPAEIGMVGCVWRFPTARKAGKMARAGPRRWRATCSPACGDSAVVGKSREGERSSAVCGWCAGVGGGVEWWRNGIGTRGKERKVEMVLSNGRVYLAVDRPEFRERPGSDMVNAHERGKSTYVLGLISRERTKKSERNSSSRARTNIDGTRPRRPRDNYQFPFISVHEKKRLYVSMKIINSLFGTVVF